MFFLANGVGKKSAHPIAETGSLVHIYICIYFLIYYPRGRQRETKITICN